MTAMLVRATIFTSIPLSMESDTHISDVILSRITALNMHVNFRPAINIWLDFAWMIVLIVRCVAKSRRHGGTVE